MAERRRSPTEVELDEALFRLGRDLEFPPTPAIAGQVRRRLAGRSARPGPARFGPWLGRLALAAVLLIALVGGLLVASPTVRTGLAERLGLRGVDIFYAPALPAAVPSSIATSEPAGVRLDLGERLTALAEAQARAPYQVVAPTLPDLAAPDEVYLRATPPGGQVALVYHGRPGLAPSTETGVGLLFSQFQGNLESAFFGKGLRPESRLEQVAVDGEPGFWIEGRPHAFFYRDQQGRIADEPVRLAGNVLLWERGDLTLRIEAAISKQEALRIAASVR